MNPDVRRILPRSRLAPTANTSDLSIERDVVGIACDATRIGLSRRLMIGRRAFGMMMRGLAREGRRRCHKHHDHDRDQRSHFNPHFTRRFSALSLPRFGTISNVTLAPSRRSLRPAFSTAEMWTNTSLPPLSGATKP